MKRLFNLSIIVALLIGGLVLWGLDIIHGEICFSVLGGFTLCLALFGGHGFDPKFLAAHLCSGGVVMGAFFMATDYTTSPSTPWGKVIFGIGCGVITCLIRYFGNYPEGVSFAILIMNVINPYICVWTRHKVFGVGGAK